LQLGIEHDAFLVQHRLQAHVAVPGMSDDDFIRPGGGHQRIEFEIAEGIREGAVDEGTPMKQFDRGTLDAIRSRFRRDAAADEASIITFEVPVIDPRARLPLRVQRGAAQPDSSRCASKNQF
jgi:hypothetical protein